MPRPKSGLAPTSSKFCEVPGVPPPVPTVTAPKAAASGSVSTSKAEGRARSRRRFIGPSSLGALGGARPAPLYPSQRSAAPALEQISAGDSRHPTGRRTRPRPYPRLRALTRRSLDGPYRRSDRLACGPHPGSARPIAGSAHRHDVKPVVDVAQISETTVEVHAPVEGVRLVLRPEGLEHTGWVTGGLRPIEGDLLGMECISDVKDAQPVGVPRYVEPVATERRIVGRVERIVLVRQ